MTTRSTFFFLALPLLACSSDAATGLAAPTGVFTRTDASGATPVTVTLAFASGKGARLSKRTASQGEITERTCFSYEGGGGAALKATLKKTVVAGNGVTTEQDQAGRVVEQSVGMTSDGSRLTSDAFLETGRFEYARDTSVGEASVMQGCP